MTSNDPFKVLTTPTPAIDVEHALHHLREQFGLSGDLKPLTSERDQNFRVTTATDGCFVLKIANSAEDPAVTDLQSAALLHIEKTMPELPVPKVFRTLDGETSSRIDANDRQHVVRVLSWLDGVPLQQSKRVPGYAKTLGTCLAQMGQALHDFVHPASSYALLWDLKRAASLRDLLDYVENPALRTICKERLDVFDATVAPHLDVVRWQVIHNDLNPSNVLVEANDATAVAGVIDFGDMVRSPLIVDIAVAAAYLLRDDDDPVEDVLEFAAAYNAVEPLLANEIGLLFDLILTRSTMTVLITHWRAARYPENREYLFRSETRARRLLQRLRHVDSDGVATRLREACALTEMNRGTDARI